MEKNTSLSDDTSAKFQGFTGRFSKRRNRVESFEVEGFCFVQRCLPFGFTPPTQDAGWSPGSKIPINLHLQIQCLPLFWEQANPLFFLLPLGSHQLVCASSFHDIKTSAAAPITTESTDMIFTSYHGTC